PPLLDGNRRVSGSDARAARGRGRPLDGLHSCAGVQLPIEYPEAGFKPASRSNPAGSVRSRRISAIAAHREAASQKLARAEMGSWLADPAYATNGWNRRSAEAHVCVRGLPVLGHNGHSTRAEKMSQRVKRSPPRS